MENYINALLNSPTTHMVNIAGNASFQALSLAERGLAGFIGNVRTLGGLRGDIGDQRYMGEALPLKTRQHDGSERCFVTYG